MSFESYYAPFSISLGIHRISSSSALHSEAKMCGKNLKTNILNPIKKKIVITI